MRFRRQDTERFGQGILWSRSQQAVKVKRTTRLGSGSRKPFPAKRLDSDDGTHHIAVDVEIAHLSLATDLAYGLIDARMQTHGQAITGRLDLSKQLIQMLAAISQHMKHRAEYFPFQLCERLNFNQSRGDIRAL